MSRKNIIYAVIISILLIGLCVAGIIAVLTIQMPLGPELSLNISTPDTFQLPTEVSTLSTVEPTSTSIVTKPMAMETIQVDGTPVTTQVADNCGMSGTMNILLIGRDANEWVPPSGAYAIRMVKIDFDQKKAYIFTFPRDLWISTPSLTNDYTISKIRLAPLYTTIRNSEQNNEADFKASNAVAQTIYDNFEIMADYYITLNETVIADIVDTIDGIKS